MARRAVHFLWLCTLLLAITILRPAAAETSLILANSRSTAGGTSHDGNTQSNSKTREALEQLRQVRSSGRPSKADKRSGVLSSALYYLKQGFFALFMNGPPSEGPSTTDAPRRTMSRPLVKAVELLEEATAQSDPDAIYLLAEMNFHGNYSHPRDYPRAFSLYNSLASLTGNSTAQYMLGFMYATGIGDAVERDQAKALLYHTFAAQQGNTRSEMTVAFRHHSGIGTPTNCHEAVVYYKRVADKAIAYARSGPPGGLPLMREAYHIADDIGGVYGDGASYSSSGHNAHKGGPGSDQNSPVDDVMEYLDLMSRKGEIKVTFSLGRVNYDGSRTVRRNFKIARKYFMQVARQYWNKDDRVISDDAAVKGKMAAKAAAYLGRLYLRGEGVPQNFDKALRWFKLGVSNGDAYCQYEMGLMYLHGYGVKKDVVMAGGYFKESAQQDWPAAQVNLGKLFLDQGDLKTATAYFELAVRHGHIEAMYHVAELHHFGIGRERSCELASNYYKAVAEKVEALHSSFDEANQSYEDGDSTSALVQYMMAAEQGYEPAQANVAWLLDEHKSILSLDRFLPWKQPLSPLLRNAALAIVYWTRSAKQFNIDSTLKMGDHYLYGHGITTDVDKAAQCYQSAAELRRSAQALWNLGWMHENGLGVEQDFHLAYRLYLEAADANSESYFPVKLSVWKLRLRSWWSQMTDGTINPIQPEPEDTAPQTWSDFFANFLSAASEDDYTRYHPGGPDHHAARDGAQGGGDGNANRDGGEAYSGTFGDEYYYDELDGAMLETITMLALAGALAFLVYYRQLRQARVGAQQARVAAERERRREEERDGREVWWGPPSTAAAAAGETGTEPGRLNGNENGGGFGGREGEGNRNDNRRQPQRVDDLNGVNGMGDEWVDVGPGGVGH